MLKFGKSLQPGDLIVVSYNNYLRPALFRKIGSRSNAQFFLISKDYLDFYKQQVDDGRKILCRYIARDAESSIAKLDPNELEPVELGLYNDTLTLLKENGVL